MSQLLVNEYLNELETLKRVSGTNTEQVIRAAFRNLLRNWARSRNLTFVEELEYDTPLKTKVYPDGTILYDLRVPHGFWEAKDTADDLDTEIAKKFRRGYPQDNIILENSDTAVLIQNRQEVTRCSMTDVEALGRLVSLFFEWERPEIADFRAAVTQFKADLPAVLGALRDMIDKAENENPAFREAAIKFLKHAQETINPSVTAADVREMLIQHILTEEIFSQVFSDSGFHRENNVAKELYALEETFFTGSVKRNTLDKLRSYYAAIRSTAALVSNHHEKQAFLKTIYENFYKVYNKKAADRLGVVYTPNEIVRFMVESADWLCQKHFGKALIDKNVEILDPACGTGTFIAELIEHFRGQKEKLRYKYREELHANEVAILPYYVANLNIEATYAAIMGGYEEYPNLCFVDTLDNVAGLGIYAGHQHDLFGSLSEENVERIKRQNKRKISVVIGNPPYNAWQENYNSRNPNRPYRRVDERIRTTYGAQGTAQNRSSLYDMYTRFFRWSADRLKDDGILALITNRNYIEKAAFDGFRKVVSEDFADIWIMDLGGDVRANPKISGTMHNVFGIQTGVAIAFFVKRKGKSAATIHYARRPEMETAEEKLAFLSANRLSSVAFDAILPDRKHNWINQTSNDWDSLVPIVDKGTRSRSRRTADRTVFRAVSNGLQTKRDDWVYDFDPANLRLKMVMLIDRYEDARRDPEVATKNEIKWDRELSRHLEKKTAIGFNVSKIVDAAYRPFTGKSVYFDRLLNSQSFRLYEMYGDHLANPTITFLSVSSANPLAALAVDGLFDTSILKNGNGSTQGLPRRRIAKDGARIDNITDWALEQFRAHYGKEDVDGRDKPGHDGGKRRDREITKDAIFHYVYAVLHDPVYREKYALNLKREFPRIPFYEDFWRWASWGEKLMALHLGYETIDPWPLERIDTADEKARSAGVAPKAILRADRTNGNIRLDTETQLTGIPQEAWDYRLGNRSALEWILDQYKEKTPRDPTIRAKFNTYRFADYKEKVIDLLMRVTRVSVETVAITEAMRKIAR